MNQLFYNIAGGIVHQIRREKRTTISEVIVCGKRNIKQNWNWFYFKFSVESSSFKLGKIYAYLWRLKQTSLSFVWFYQSVFLSKIVAFHPRTVERIVTALMLSLLFRCFSLLLPHFRTLVQGKRSENCLRFGTGGLSLCLYPLLSRNILFFPALTMAARAKKKNSGEAICSRYQRALPGFWARLRILNLIVRLC